VIAPAPYRSVTKGSTGINMLNPMVFTKVSKPMGRNLCFMVVEDIEPA